jgi:hypothetical protein
MVNVWIGNALIYKNKKKTKKGNKPRSINLSENNPKNKKDR